MKHFKVLQYEEVDELAAAVEHAINDGWEVVGQMTITAATAMSPPLYNQPIIKTTRDERYKGWKDCIYVDCNDPCIEGSSYCKQHCTGPME